jgi:RNA polymerase sigma-70 factor (ECF subfamily)
MLSTYPARQHLWGETVLEYQVTDEQLLLEYRASGNRELFAQLVGRYERELFVYLRRYLGNAEMAEDVFQATFLQVHLKCDQFQSGRRVRPWLYTIATNQAIDANRRNRRHRAVSLDRAGRQQSDEVGKLSDLLESGESDPLEHAQLVEKQRLVQTTLEELPEQMYAVIHLVYYQGMKYREAAEVLEVPVGTVKSRLNSAIAKLSQAMESSPIHLS